MTASITTKYIKDGAGDLIARQVLDVSGTGAGPFLALQAIASADGTGALDLGTLLSGKATAAQIGEVQAVPTTYTVLDRLKTIASGLGAVVLAAGTAVIGKVGLQVGGSDVAASNPLPTRLTGANYQASGISAVTGTIAAAGNSTAFTPAAGRQVYLTLSGGTSLSGAIQWSLDGGTTWSAIDLGDGTRLGAIAYAGTTITIPVPTPEQAGAQIRLAASAASGTVAYSFSQ